MPRPNRAPERFEADGGALTFTRSGVGPPLVLVHGLSGSRRWWRRNLAAFEARFTVYRLELVGFGYARRQPPLPLARSAALLARWMETRGPGRAHLLGHSMGGHTCLHVAESFPGVVDRLVLAAPSGLLRGQWWRVALRLPRAAASAHLDFLPVVATDALRAGLVTLYRATAEILRDDVAERLPRLQAPTLVVSGGRDRLVPSALGARLARALPDGRHVCYPRAGHVVMWDAAPEFNREVIAFLSGETEAR